MPHVQQLKVPGVQQDAAAAIAALRERTGASKIATVGFCLGGFESFLAGADMADLAGVIGFYGVLTGSRFGVDGPLERAGDIRAPLLGLFGGADQGIPVEQVEEFDAELTESGLDHEIHVYPGAPHSFFDRRYADYAEACEDAWRRMLGFLESQRSAWQPPRFASRTGLTARPAAPHDKTSTNLRSSAPQRQQEAPPRCLYCLCASRPEGVSPALYTAPSPMRPCAFSPLSFS